MNTVIAVCVFIVILASELPPESIIWFCLYVLELPQSVSPNSHQPILKSHIVRFITVMILRLLPTFQYQFFFLIDTHDTRKLKEEMCALAHNFRRTSVRHVRESKAACMVLCLCMEILLSNCLHAMDRNQRNRADPAMSKNFKGTVNQ